MGLERGGHCSRNHIPPSCTSAGVDSTPLDLEQGRLQMGHSDIASRSTRAAKFSVLRFTPGARPTLSLLPPYAGWSPARRCCRSRGGSPSCAGPGDGRRCCMGCSHLSLLWRMPPLRLPRSSATDWLRQPWRSWGRPLASGKRSSACSQQLFCHAALRPICGCRPWVKRVAVPTLWRQGPVVAVTAACQLDPCRQALQEVFAGRSHPSSIPPLSDRHWQSTCAARE